MKEKLKIGISSCLLGNEVRFDGGHRHNLFFTHNLGKFIDFVPFCPEVAVGLGIPRPPIQLVREFDSIRVRGVDNNDDLTGALHDYGIQTLPQVKQLCGFVFKTRSPSCGLDKVKVVENDTIATYGTGAFAYTIRNSMPYFPVEDDERLMIPHLRENFIERILVMDRWHRLAERGFNTKNLYDFHRRHMFIIQAHSESAYRQLRHFINSENHLDFEVPAMDYLSQLMEVLKTTTTEDDHARILSRIVTTLKGQISRAVKIEIMELIDEFRSGNVPIIMPLTMIKHILRNHPNDYLEEQYYLISPLCGGVLNCL